MMNPRARQGGYIMMEVALAVVVLAIGILAVFSLLGSGLDTSRKSVSEQSAALFADSVLQSLRAHSLAMSQSTNADAWLDFWGDFSGGITNLPGAASFVWADDTNSAVYGDGFLYTNLYAISLSGGPETNVTETSVTDHALRYSLSIHLTNAAAWTDATNRACVTLRVWPDAFGPANDRDAVTFYAEFNNSGNL